MDALIQSCWQEAPANWWSGMIAMARWQMGSAYPVQLRTSSVSPSIRKLLVQLNSRPHYCSWPNSQYPLGNIGYWWGFSRSITIYHNKLALYYNDGTKHVSKSNPESSSVTWPSKQVLRHFKLFLIYMALSSFPNYRHVECCFSEQVECCFSELLPSALK